MGNFVGVDITLLLQTLDKKMISTENLVKEGAAKQYNSFDKGDDITVRSFGSLFGFVFLTVIHNPCYEYKLIF